ncbi:basic salivary proline-rich protein 1-like [Homarus americanus]|uniref:basic salivary proline-rich protein 1-like n=1 Tax=Homarus americanus TaxID=6706 RepID=UPI001C46156B|nr:basic salivary proline-rich protein 1-like [Homarus americanus]
MTTRNPQGPHGSTSLPQGALPQPRARWDYQGSPGIPTDKQGSLRGPVGLPEVPEGAHRTTRGPPRGPTRARSTMGLPESLPGPGAPWEYQGTPIEPTRPKGLMRLPGSPPGALPRQIASRDYQGSSRVLMGLPGIPQGPHGTTRGTPRVPWEYKSSPRGLLGLSRPRTPWD